MYAIIETGGKQYKVREGDTVDIELVGGEIGDAVELEQVLLVAGDDEIAVGSPTVEGALVRATVIDEVKGDKVVVFKYKPKNRYRRKTGHRQKYTRLQIDEIVIPGIEAEFEEEIAEVIEEAPAIEVSAAEAPELTEAAAEAEALAEPETPEEAPAIEAPAAEAPELTEAAAEAEALAEPETPEEAPAIEAPATEASEPAEVTTDVEAIVESEMTEAVTAEETEETAEETEETKEPEAVEEPTTQADEAEDEETAG